MQKIDKTMVYSNYSMYIFQAIKMDKFTVKSTSSYTEACGPSRFQHRVLHENLQAAQAQRADHQNEEVLNHLSLVIMNTVTTLFT